jgi:hypothetical protein
MKQFAPDFGTVTVLYAAEKSFSNVAQAIEFTILLEFLEGLPPRETVGAIFFMFSRFDDGFEPMLPRELADELGVIRWIQQ